MENKTRLAAVAELVPPCKRIADIGTDHAYLPIELIKTGKVAKAVAADIGRGPLQAAREHVEGAGLTAQISCRLGNGLQVLRPGEVDGIIMAGMGGPLMVDILAAAPAVVERLRFMVLQPMTKSGRVRRYLQRSGWHVERESLALESDVLYQIIYALPGADESTYTDLEYEVGPRLRESKAPLLALHYERLLAEKKYIVAQLQASPAQAERAAQLMADIKVLEGWLWELQSKK